ncbi:uncharacterized protein METZ01_LOCUS488518, partial [marine metagenome]
EHRQRVKQAISKASTATKRSSDEIEFPVSDKVKDLVPRILIVDDEAAFRTLVHSHSRLRGGDGPEGPRGAGRGPRVNTGSGDHRYQDAGDGWHRPNEEPQHSVTDPFGNRRIRIRGQKRDRGLRLRWLCRKTAGKLQTLVEDTIAKAGS